MCISKVAATGAIAYNSIIHNGIITSNNTYMLAINNN